MGRMKTHSYRRLAETAPLVENRDGRAAQHTQHRGDFSYPDTMCNTVCDTSPITLYSLPLTFKTALIAAIC